ncbi:MAG: HD family phosphohydrolase [Gammaproteobacteria bacterium]|nr:MAG: HD family phosphohydrolase [Gammaproteobacteria bacterium]
MPHSPTRLLVSDQAPLAPELLQQFSQHAECLQIASPDDVPLNGEATLLVLTPEQAEALLEHLPPGSPMGPQALAVVVWRADPQQPLNGALLDHPLVVGVLDQSCPVDTVYATLRSGLTRLHGSDESGAAQMLERVLDIGRALASEKDLDTLLDLILTHARELTNADGASIYTKDSNGKLYFRLWQNYSTDARSNAQQTLVGDYSVAGYVARTGELVTVDDAYAIPESAPYRFSPAVDSSIGYRTRSMLTVPLKNKADDVVGVLQLINRKDRADILLKTPKDVVRHVLPFDELSRSVALALSGQAGVAIENTILYSDIECLFEGFIRASVQAIEARDPTTAGHSFRVADLTGKLAQAVDRSDQRGLRDVLFTHDQFIELRYAALLHDFGKVGVREDVLVKAKKLYAHQLEIVQQRFKYARASIARDAYRRLLNLQEQQQLRPEELAARRREIEDMLAQESEHLDGFWEIVLRMNEPTISRELTSGDLNTVAEYTFPDDSGTETALLQSFEFAHLTLAKGNLNIEERAQIESHVSHTFSFLSLIPWTKSLSRLPEIAYAHHEKLNGTGYPRGLSGPEIPVQSRIMTIADIYDALTARDRPYKSSLPMEKALDILHAEANAGQIDPVLLTVFVESRAYLSSS